MKRISVKTIKRQAIIIVLFILFFGVPFHFWTVDRKGTLQALYPLSGALSSWMTECSEGAPPWLARMMRLGVWTLRASASQSAFIDGEGRLHHCESGWENGALLSPVVTEQSLFQYGSLTKPVTAALIIALVNEGKLEFDRSVVDVFDGSVNIENNQALRSVTIRNLMRFESGVFGEVFQQNQRPWCPYNMEELFNQKTWEMPAGSHRYSNLSHCILGAVASEIYMEDFRSVASEVFNLSRYGIKFVDAPSNEDLVSPDYRYHDFYREDLEPSFDYLALSSTAGMAGSAVGYAKLMRELLGSKLDDYLTRSDGRCDASVIRNCYGDLFYLYESPSGRKLNLKEGFMPGFASIVAVNENREVFVWLGNTDTPNAKSGERIKKFIDILSQSL